MWGLSKQINTMARNKRENLFAPTMMKKKKKHSSAFQRNPLFQPCSSDYSLDFKKEEKIVSCYGEEKGNAALK